MVAPRGDAGTGRRVSWDEEQRRPALGAKETRAPNPSILALRNDGVELQCSRAAALGGVAPSRLAEAVRGGKAGTTQLT